MPTFTDNPVSTYQVPNIGQKSPQLGDLGFYADIRFDVDDTAPNYIGLHILNGASTSLDTWKIYKVTYGTGTAVVRYQLAYGSWDGRVGLF